MGLVRGRRIPLPGKAAAGLCCGGIIDSGEGGGEVGGGVEKAATCAWMYFLLGEDGLTSPQESNQGVKTRILRILEAVWPAFRKTHSQTEMSPTGFRSSTGLMARLHIAVSFCSVPTYGDLSFFANSSVGVDRKIDYNAWSGNNHI